MGYKHNALEKTKHDFIGEEITDEKEEILINFRLGVDMPISKAMDKYNDSLGKKE
jgi:hypothetical protein